MSKPQCTKGERWPPFTLPTVDFVAGTLAGAAQVMVGQPLDLVKVRSQIAAPGVYRGPMDIVIKTVKGEGLLALYKGMTSPLLGIAAQNALLFTAFQGAKRLISPESQELSTVKIALAGAMAGGLNSILSCPIELFKIRMQSQITSKSFTHHHQPNQIRHVSNSGKLSIIAKKVYATYGIKNGVMRGFWITFMREIPAYSAFYTGFELSKSFLLSSLPTKITNDRTSLPIWALMISGSTAGILNWLACYPLDLLQTKIQLTNNPLPKGFRGPLLLKYISDQAISIFKNQGAKAFFVGLSPTLLRAIPAAAATFTTFELVKQAALQKP
ncbi:related to YMC1 - putative mitochondrial inner membrane transporter [Melanopsichium pennsylvanicum]|uniref:Related to YMC1 - putative mitochondrial inner membrane transporter n=1 Tax=Melanopsichium pennsylvanicum TaxID=63383 RepID=A0AAJ4XH64_9BASI|nr:related to YMC1 - putative mitochondrial inner membrane transporter [Melanopsichium pennsylvanicum]